MRLSRFVLSLTLLGLCAGSVAYACNDVRPKTRIYHRESLYGDRKYTCTNGQWVESTQDCPETWDIPLHYMAGCVQLEDELLYCCGPDATRKIKKHAWSTTTVMSGSCSVEGSVVQCNDPHTEDLNTTVGSKKLCSSEAGPGPCSSGTSVPVNPPIETPTQAEYAHDW